LNPLRKVLILPQRHFGQAGDRNCFEYFDNAQYKHWIFEYCNLFVFWCLLFV